MVGNPSEWVDLLCISVHFLKTSRNACLLRRNRKEISGGISDPRTENSLHTFFRFFIIHTLSSGMPQDRVFFNNDHTASSSEYPHAPEPKPLQKSNLYLHCNPSTHPCQHPIRTRRGCMPRQGVGMALAFFTPPGRLPTSKAIQPKICYHSPVITAAHTNLTPQ
jgi:hypothetical protein